MASKGEDRGVGERGVFRPVLYQSAQHSRGKERALWRHLHRADHGELGGAALQGQRVAWIVQWRREVDGRFEDSGIVGIFSDPREAYGSLEWHEGRAVRGESYRIRTVQYPAGKLGRSTRFLGYRLILDRKKRGGLLDKSKRDAFKDKHPEARFVRCYLPCPVGMAHADYMKLLRAK